MSATSEDNFDKYELSINQKRLLEKGVVGVNNHYIQLVLEVENSISKTVLIEAIHAVMVKNETAMMNINTENNLCDSFQIINTDCAIDVLERYLQSSDEYNIHKIADECLSTSYDPAKDSSVRICLLTVGNMPKIKYLCVRVYTLFCDNYSAFIFYNDLQKAIQDLDNYKASKREVVSYQNFATWQKELYIAPDIEGVNFWKNYDNNALATYIPYQRDTEDVFAPTHIIITKIPNKPESFPKQLGDKGMVELYFFSKFLMFLKMFQNDQVTVGYTPFKRFYEELNNTFGLVNKELPITVSLENSRTEQELQKSLKNTINEIDVWSDYFFQKNENPNSKVLPYFKYSFEYLDMTVSETKGESDLNTIKLNSLKSITDYFDVKISCVETNEDITVNLYYDANKFDQSGATLLEQQLTNFFTSYNGQSGSTPSDYEIALIASSNNTSTKGSSYNNVLALINEHIEKTPEAIAIDYNNKQITYLELEERSNQLANYLINTHGVQHNVAVGILLDRSEWFIISMLAILKTGAFYVPLDTEYPKERLSYIVNDSNLKVLISSQKYIESLAITELDTVIPNTDKIYQDGAKTVTGIEISSNSTAYCIYTSGSTGKPKGCLIQHSNLLNYINWANEYYYDTDACGDWGFITSVSFDLTITSLFSSLTRGKKIWVGSSEKNTFELLEETFSKASIDSIKLTPTHIAMLQDLNIKQTSIKNIICGGEALEKRHVSVLKSINESFNIYNEYGPTETTVGCTVKKIYSKDDSITIGSPIANTKIRIINTQGEDVPVGVLGEICITGAGVCSGYLNNPKLSAERFVPGESLGAKRMYRTGDIGRWLPSGEIAYVGRKDDQIKLNGYRIELAEIESALLGIDEIEEAVVLLSEIDNVKKLTAFVVGSKQDDEPAIRAKLLEVIPNYMVPALFIILEKLPVSNSGKIDRQKLRAKLEESTLRSKNQAPPKTDLEKQVLSIWKEVFDDQMIGMNDDFFHLGGHSIKLIKLINTYQQVFDVKLELKTFFLNTSLQAHSDVIKNSETSNTNDIIESAPEQENYPLSLMQRRLWLVSQNVERSIAYNIGSEMLLDHLDQTSFEKAIRAVIDRHEALRTVFKKNKSGEVRQFIVPNAAENFTFTISDFRNSENRDEEIDSFVKEKSKLPFNLEESPLLRAGLIRKSDTHYVFYYFMHHIIADAWSMDVLSSEFMKLYQYYAHNIPHNLPKLEIQYKDYTVWQSKQIDSDAFKQHQSFWIKYLVKDIPKLNLLFSKDRPSLKTYAGEEQVNVVGNDVLNQFLAATKSINATPFVNFLALINILLYHNSFQKELIVGSPLAGRDHLDLKDQIGVFINTIPFKNTIDTQESYLAFLKRVKEGVLEVYNHKDYPFDLIVEDIGMEPDLSRNPVFDTMLVVTHNDKKSAMDALKNKTTLNVSSKFDITFYINLQENGMVYTINYNPNLFAIEDMKSLSSQFLKLITLIGDDSSKKIQDYAEGLKDEVVKMEQHAYTQSMTTDLNEEF